MSNLKLFRIQGDSLVELEGSSAPLERGLQTLFERNLESLLGIRFLASEYVTTHGGRMDTLGIDENGYPVIIEYKRERSENVINQGLFYLDWLVDHRGDFELLVRDRCGKELARQIEWSAPRLICIAADFTKYDIHAVKQIGRNIELIRYRRFGDELLLLELLPTVTASPVPATLTSGENGISKAQRQKSISELMEGAGPDLLNLYMDIESFMLGLGDDVTKKILRHYIAFRRIKNFVCVEVKPTIETIRMYLKLDPDTVKPEEGFTRDVRNIGHYGTGDLEVTVRSRDDWERAKLLVVKSYEMS